MAGFVEHRGVLLGVAYRVLGRFSDAEDVVQDAWLRWSQVDEESVDDPEAFLVTVTTRLALDRLRQIKARRETYVGEWLPDPVPTTGDIADGVLRAESVSMAVLVVLETLTPLERAVFVLRDVFEVPYGEIATALEKKEPAVRKLAARARAHVRERTPRFDVDPGEWRRVTDRFIGACLDGGLDALMETLAPDVRLVPDSGGRTIAPRRAIAGPDKVAAFLLSVLRFRPPFLRSAGADPAAEIGFRMVTANGGPAVLVTADGRPIVHFQLQVAGGRVTTCYLVTNPDKLAAVMSQDGTSVRP